jgi:hypothetical protein
MRHSLKLHPDSRCGAVTAIDVGVSRRGAGTLILSYEVTGAIGDLRLPLTTAPARADELWRHTCFEAFICPAVGETYTEFNFAPSTQWAAYRFDGYRAGMRIAEICASPRIEVQSASGRFTLLAVVDLDALPSGPWRVGLSAVIEETNSNKSYWALAHPHGKPDFHHSDCFACEI